VARATSPMADPAGDHISRRRRSGRVSGRHDRQRSQVFGSLRLRYFGPRPLIEDDSGPIPSHEPDESRAGYKVSKSARIAAGYVQLVRSAKDSRHRLLLHVTFCRAEPLAGITDGHFHATLAAHCSAEPDSWLFSMIELIYWTLIYQNDNLAYELQERPRARKDWVLFGSFALLGIVPDDTQGVGNRQSRAATGISLTGIVRDTTGLVLPGATVELGLPAAPTRSTVSAADGTSSFPGRQRWLLSAPGGRSQTSSRSTNADR